MINTVGPLQPACFQSSLSQQAFGKLMRPVGLPRSVRSRAHTHTQRIRFQGLVASSSPIQDRAPIVRGSRLKSLVHRNILKSELREYCPQDLCELVDSSRSQVEKGRV